MCSPNPKEQMKDIKMEWMTLKLWHTLRCYGIKEKKFSHIRGLSLNPKVYLNLKSSYDYSLIVIIGPSGKSPFEKEDFGLKVTSMLCTQHPKSYKASMNFLNLGSPCCMPTPKMIRTSWTLRRRLQYILAKGLFQKRKRKKK